jgi:hypothetical protein
MASQALSSSGEQEIQRPSFGPNLYFDPSYLERRDHYFLAGLNRDVQLGGNRWPLKRTREQRTIQHADQQSLRLRDQFVALVYLSYEGGLGRRCRRRKPLRRH